ncbi:Rieske (2Fe-2S) protein [Pseudonocardia alni]|uniref:Rieske (2Fe-2S) protein n=1 Tax=Pseudonocardia alni TaxID=33907 RepID=UPI00280BDBAF|nr:Rieske 2Fe-2S domain-containing protein [Pseudonocardia alni]
MSDIETTRWVATVPFADLARRRRLRVEVDGRPVALFLAGDRVVALDDVCIHKGRSLARGVLWQGRVVCPAHQWAFDPVTGRADGRDECQPVHDVRVVDGVIHVDARPRTQEEN